MVWKYVLSEWYVGPSIERKKEVKQLFPYSLYTSSPDKINTFLNCVNEFFFFLSF